MSELISITSHDYFEVEFNRLFSPNDLFFLPLFNILNVKFNEFDREKPYPGETIEKLENVMIFRYGQHIQFINDKIQEICSFRLKGQGCREFEDLGGKWIDLFDFCLLNCSKFKRWDVFREVHTPGIIREQYIEKIKAGEFTTRFKSINEEESFIVDAEGIAVSLKDYKIKDNSKSRAASQGFSITFGKKQSHGYQLQIYDKSAERYAKKYSYMSDTAIRIECRLFGDKIKGYLLQAYQAMKRNELPLFASNLIITFLDIKETFTTDKKNYYRVHTWKPWLRELGLDPDNKEKIINLSSAPAELSLEKKFSWAFTMFRKSLSEMYLLMERIGTPHLFEQFITGAMKEGVNMIDHAMLARLNQALQSLDLLDEDTRFNSVSEVQDILQKRTKSFVEFHPFIKHFLKDYKYDDKQKTDEEEQNALDAYDDF